VNDGILRKMGRKTKYSRAALEATLRAIHAVPVPHVDGTGGQKEEEQEQVLLAPWGHVTLRTTLMVFGRKPRFIAVRRKEQKAIIEYFVDLTYAPPPTLVPSCVRRWGFPVKPSATSSSC